jgi:hypothetical protein
MAAKTASRQRAVAARTTTRPARAGTRGGVGVPDVTRGAGRGERAGEGAARGGREALAAALVGGAAEGVAERRIRVHGARQRGEPEVVRHGERDLAEDVAGARRDEGGAEDAVAAARHVHAEEAVLGAVEHRAVVLGEGNGDRVVRRAVVRQLVGRAADVRHLGARVRAPGQDEPAALAAPEAAEEGVGHGEARHGVGGVREARPAGDAVADGEDARVRRAEAVVDDDAVIDDLHAGDVEGERLDVRASPGGDEQGVAGELVRAVRRGHRQRGGAVGPAPRRGGACVQVQRHAVGGEGARDDRRGVGVVARQEARATRGEGDAAAEAHEGLRQLAGDGAAAEHEEVRRRPLEAEDGLVGVRAALGQPGHVGERGTPAGGDDGAAEAERARRAGVVGDRERVGPREARVAEQHVGAEPLEALGRVGGGEAGAQGAHAGEGGRGSSGAVPCAWAACAARRSALLGTQPRIRQSPPMRRRSTRAVRAPRPTAMAALTSPAVPAPTTTRS